ITFGATGSTPPATPITRIVIDPPTPFTFPVFPDLTGLMTALYTVTFHDKAIKPELRVACTPASVLRGVLVTCEATVTGGVPFTVIERRARGKGFEITDLSPVFVPGGQSFIWDGDAVAETAVTFTVTFSDDGQVRNASAKSSYRITPRSWSPLELRQAPQHLIALSHTMIDSPTMQNRSVGLFEFDHLDPLSLAIAQTGTGPNQGLHYVVSEVALPDVSIAWTHPGLYGGRVIDGVPVGFVWYNDQNGQPKGTCTQAVFNGLAPMIEVHEGVTRAPNSHWGVTNAAFAGEQLHATFERLYTDLSAGALRARVIDLYNDFLTGRFSREQKTFEDKDSQRIFGSLGCDVDLNPKDN
ncbi:MAG: hypothetical protein ACREMQ_10665, partial [Longimicrobiales bacterium]